MDNVYEMMSRNQYIVWSAKPENGSILMDEAGTEWDGMSGRRIH